MLSGQISLVPKLLVLSQLLLCFSPHDHVLLPKIGICGLTRIFEVWTVLEAWTLLYRLPPPCPSVAHIRVGLQLLVPLFPASLA